MLDLATFPPLEALNAHLLRDDGGWPLKCEQPILRQLNTWAALRESDKPTIKTIAGWTDEKRQYRVDPLPERIADAWAAYLWGEDPRVLAGDEQDQPWMDELLGLDPTGGGAVLLASELERSAGLGVSEGEVWSRIYVDENVAPRPLLEWHSRRHVVPLWVGPRLAATSLWTELPQLPGDHDAGTVWRAFELHAPGAVVNVLYRGKSSELGVRAELTDHPMTANIAEAWRHGLPGMLMERIPNRLRGSHKLGISDYAGILDFILDLNEAATIGATNMRLTARKRAVVSAAAAAASRRATDPTLEPELANAQATPRVTFDPAEELFVEDPLDAELGSSGGSPFRILEYSFDAQALIDWQRNLVETALSRVALTGQYVGTGDTNQGYAISGTAIRLKLIPTDKTGRAKARYWEDGLPRIVGNMVRLDALGAQSGGFGRGWAQPETTPTIQRRPGLPVDDLEEAQRHSTLITAGLESIQTAVRKLNPDWTEQQISDEVDAIRADKRAATPGTVGSVFGA